MTGSTATIERVADHYAELRVYEGPAGWPHPYVHFLGLKWTADTEVEIRGLVGPFRGRHWKAIAEALWAAGVRQAWWDHPDKEGRKVIHGVLLSHDGRRVRTKATGVLREHKSEGVS